jgi:hypothetical protein
MSRAWKRIILGRLGKQSHLKKRRDRAMSKFIGKGLFQGGRKKGERESVARKTSRPVLLKKLLCLPSTHNVGRQ